MKVAIVGAGWMGGVHAGAIDAAGDSVALVIDADPGRAETIAAAHGASAATELSRAADCDAAVIATPSAAHLGQAVALAAEGVPLLVEKPHRLPGEDPEALRAALLRGGGLYRVGLTTRFHPGLQRLKSALHDQALGEIVAYSDSYHFRLDPGTLSPWYFDRASAGGGVVTTNGVHLIDRAGWLLGGRPEVLEAEGLVTMFDDHAVEDHAQITLRVNGVTARLSLLWAPFDTPAPELRVIGRKGIARVWLDGWRIETAAGVEAGSNDRPDDAFTAQWRAFRDRLAGHPGGADCPDLETMEATMEIIGEIYGRKEIAA